LVEWRQRHLSRRLGRSIILFGSHHEYLYSLGHFFIYKRSGLCSNGTSKVCDKYLFKFENEIFYFFEILIFYLKSGFTRVSNYLSWINSQTFNSRIQLDAVVDNSPIKVNANDELTDLTNTGKSSYDVTVQVYQDNQTNN
jgi:hypothetical protein